MKNKNLTAAKNAKNDEFYTRLCDIENEMKHYREHFRGKVIYCNCDDPRESGFFKFFSLNFEFLGLKKLITTGYKSDGHGVKYVYEGDKNGNRRVDDEEVQVIELEGNGDFRSPECVELLKEADIVVTNPPFSLFREYIAQLVEYGKKFLVIGNMNAITYKEIFPLIKDNKLWLGMTGGRMEFRVPDEYEMRDCRSWRDENGVNWRSLGNSYWFTNLTHHKRSHPLTLVRWYEREPQSYPHYDNYDAIEVSKVCNIPMDYEGVMGVPITFLDNYCPEQFEILGIQQRNDDPYKIKRYDKSMYKNANDLNARGVLIINGKPKSMYPRILIRLKQTSTYADFLKQVAALHVFKG